MEDVEQFGFKEVFGVEYRDMTPFHKHLLRETRRARQKYKEDRARSNAQT